MNTAPAFAPAPSGIDSIGSEGLVWLAGAACQLFRIPYDPRLLLQQFPPPHVRASLLEALQALGFRAAMKPLAAQALPGLSAPAFLAVADGSDATTSGLAFVLLLRCDAERITYLEPGKQ